ncbi:MAG: UDP-N-acetylmuramoyl-L-alanine--D-glutamate ligase [Coriobacteriales bacterium]|nr:UDP-N-acetylmuramoyl-L-alanine--D-glutamate ligase [Coriobacteriales bacterium]
MDHVAAASSSHTTNEAIWNSVCVLGLGRTGFAVARYLVQTGAHGKPAVTLYGGANAFESDQSRELEALGVRVVCGTEQIEGHYDLAVVSPGIPENSAFFLSAREHADELIGEPEFAWRETPERWVAITGTNGKTTTTLLTTELLSGDGSSAQAVGNVGTAATGQVAAREEGCWFVAELSSFQLATTKLMHPRAACLLNVTPDHLEWHGSMEAYAAAKEQVFANLTSDELCVLGTADQWCLDAAARLDARGMRVCRVSTTDDPGTPCAAFVRDGKLVVRLDGQERVLVATDELSLKGEHNVQNVLCASAMALDLGATLAHVREVLRSFAPLEHRIEPCGELAGVQFVNDSKGTNVDSVEKALTAFPARRVIVLLGGHDKGTTLESLSRAVCAQCKAAVCYGEAGPRMAQALRDEASAAADKSALEICEAPHMEQALHKAIELAVSGDVVLLSPACSSFDEFKSYGERGRVFKDLVAAHIAASQDKDAASGGLHE